MKSSQALKQYRCLNQNIFQQGDYALVPFREIDLYKVKNWRNEQIKVLRQKKPLTDDVQANYWRTVIMPTFDEMHPTLILFSFLKNDTCIGYGGLTNIDWEARRAEVSFLLETSRILDTATYQADFRVFLQLLQEVAFDQLKLHRLFSETYDIRPAHVAVLEQSGFQYEGRMRDHVVIDGQYVDSLIHGLVRSENQ